MMNRIAIAALAGVVLTGGCGTSIESRRVILGTDGGPVPVALQPSAPDDDDHDNRVCGPTCSDSDHDRDNRDGSGS